MIQRCLLCGHSGLDVESRIVSDESPLGYHREPRCLDGTACEERVSEHRLDGLCWCQPLVKDSSDGLIYVHRRTIDSPHEERAAKRETT